MPTETIEAKEIFRGFIALRRVDGARVSREIIEHSKAATVLEARQYQHCQHERRAKLPLKPQSAKQETALPNMQVQDDPASRWRMHRSQETKKPFTVEELMERHLAKVGPQQGQRPQPPHQ
jgi:hypothetical protein